MKWGKHQGLSIEELCQDHLPYVYWCIEYLFENFCLSAEAVETLTANGIPLNEFHMELNREKVLWYQSGFEAQWKPVIYQLLETDMPGEDDPPF